MNDVFVAHRRTHDKKEQTVSEHLMATALIARRLAGKLGITAAGELLGMLHDFGKYSRQFQAYIQSATGILNPDADDEYVDASALKGKIDRSSAGAQWIWENFRRYGPQGEFVGQILALCLASHHSGLIDCLNSEGENVFVKRMHKDVAKTHMQECTETADGEVMTRRLERY